MKTKIFLPLILIVFILTSCNQQSEQGSIQSLESLATTIKGEITAHAKYLSYAEKAIQDSMFEIAALFRAAAIAEKAHADRQITMLLTLDGSFNKFDPHYPAGTVAENLQDAIKVENYEAVDMYPGFIKISEEEQLSDLTESFKWALKAEEKHRELFKLALLRLDKPDTQLPMAYMVCPRCGNTLDAEHYSDPCDICENEASKFTRVD